MSTSTPAPASFTLENVDWNDPRAVALRTEMEAEMDERYGSSHGDEPVEVTEARMRALAVDPAGVVRTILALDAYALGVLPKVEEIAQTFANRLVLTPNTSEADRLLERDSDGDADTDLVADTLAIARRYRAVVSCHNVIAHPDGRVWQSGTGHSGLGTSGSGDVLAGAITGLCARGAEPAQAAVWASHAHAAAGDRLSVRVGPLGFLARELLDELPLILVEVEG